MHILLIAFPLLFHYASALDVAFRLVSFSPNPPSVSINNGSPVLLDNYPQHPSAPYYTKNITAPATSFTYKYTVDGVTESFDRSFEQGATETHNDFFGRKDTPLKIPALPRAFPDKSWGRGWGLTPLFDDSYVPTIWLEGEQGQIDAVLTGNSKSTNLTVFGIFKDEVFTLPKVTELNAADPKKINFGKKGFSLKFAKKEDIYGRDQLTFKPSVQDPTMLREKLYADLLDACGLPSTRMVHARVYANKSPVGLYLLSDNVDTASFFKAEFHGQTGFKNYAAIGTVIKPYTTFTFIYNGPTRADYPEVGVSFLGTNPVSNPVQSLLDSVLAPLATIQPGSEDGVKNSLEMRLDLDGFLKTVALEWLAGHWRGVWGQATKFMLYEDPVLTQNNWYYISANAEQTFGLGLTSDVVPRNIISKKYSEYQVGAPRPLIQKLLLAKRYGDRFANVLTDIVKTTFNPAALKMRIDGTVARIRAEVEWDRTLTRLPGGLADLYEIGDFDLGLTATTERIVGPNGTVSAGWGIESWVSGRAESVSSMFGFQLPQTVIPGPDPIVSAPTEDQLKGNLLEKRSNSNSVKNSLHGTERVAILLLVAVFIVRGW